MRHFTTTVVSLLVGLLMLAVGLTVGADHARKAPVHHDVTELTCGPGTHVESIAGFDARYTRTFCVKDGAR